MLLRLRRLPADALTVARAVAILGTTPSSRWSPRSPSSPRPTGRRHGRPRAGRDPAPEQPLGFVHPLVRDAVYHELPSGERELGHARAAHCWWRRRARRGVATQLLAAPRGASDGSSTAWRRPRRLGKGAADSAVAYLDGRSEPPPPELPPRSRWTSA